MNNCAEKSFARGIPFEDAVCVGQGQTLVEGLGWGIMPGCGASDLEYIIAVMHRDACGEISAGLRKKIANRARKQLPVSQNPQPTDHRLAEVGKGCAKTGVRIFPKRAGAGNQGGPAVVSARRSEQDRGVAFWSPCQAVMRFFRI